MNTNPDVAPGTFDPLAQENGMPGQTKAETVKRPKIRFYDPVELAGYEVPPGFCLVGEMHLFEGGIFVLGGASGIGKSRALTALAVSGATGRPWFGLPVHRKFKTLIIQAENGMVRLSAEFRELDSASLQGWVKVSGDADTLDFTDPAVKQAVRDMIQEFRPDVVVLDPWNRATRDTMEKDYRQAFDEVLACLADFEPRPALVICAHTRKPRQGERAHGRGLLNLLSGSLVLGSIPRAVFILQTATDDPEDNRIVFTCSKNNNGELGPASAWRRTAKGYEGPLADFDWQEFYGEGSPKSPSVTLDHLRQVFGDGETWLPKAEAARQLEHVAGVGRSTAYKALEEDGRFGKVLRWNPANKKMSVQREGDSE